MKQLTKKIIRLLAVEHGIALVLVLVFTAAIMLLGTALLTNALNEMLITGYQKQELQQLYLAEAGLEAGIAMLQADFFYNQPLTGDLMDGSFRVTFENSSADSRRIRSAGTVDEFTYVLQIEVYLHPDGSLSYGQWQRL